MKATNELIYILTDLSSILKLPVSYIDKNDNYLFSMGNNDFITYDPELNILLVDDDCELTSTEYYSLTGLCVLRNIEFIFTSELEDKLLDLKNSNK